MSNPSLLALDWGTTSFRAFLLDEDGAILGRRAAKAGIMQVQGGSFPEVLEEQVGDWLADHPALPIIAAGMIGSRQGWVEAPYLACPCSLQLLSSQLLRHAAWPDRPIHFVPGLKVEGDKPDVMRGEETELVGQGAMDEDMVFVLPGTHSKWVLAEGGRIQGFATYMTGEVFGLLKEHSILGRLMEGQDFVEETFHRGVAAALDEPALLHLLFSARTLPLTGLLQGNAVASYLSGVLIGSEIKGAAARLSGRPLTLVGQGELADRYAAALACAGLDARRSTTDAAARGLFVIARAARLL